MRTVNTHLALPVSASLAALLAELVSERERSSITLNFRDDNYSAQNGGFHPVEIRLEYCAEQWHIRYITEFSYVGRGPYAELEKALDFDFRCGIFQTAFGVFPIESALDLYHTWEANFISYWHMQVFTVTLSED